MQLTAPVAVTGAIQTISNPSQPNASTPATAVQVTNSSPWLFLMLAGGRQVYLEAFSRLTVPLGPSTDTVTLNPSFDTLPGATGSYLASAWLAAGETPPNPDGPLTAAATAAAISGDVSITGAVEQATVIYKVGSATPVIVPGTPYTTTLNLEEYTCALIFGIVAGSQGGSWAGVQIQFIGPVTGINWYTGRPMAKYKGLLSLPALVWMSVFPGDVEDQQVELELTATGSNATVPWVLLGIQETVPPWTPPTQPGQVAQNANSSAAVGTDILPALTDGSHYLVQSVWFATPTEGVGYIYTNGGSGNRIIGAASGSVQGPIACTQLSIISGNAADTVEGGCSYGWADG